MIKNLLLVGLGGGIGSILRYAFTLLVSAKKIPYATLSVNIIGSFLIGLVLAFSIKDESFANNWKYNLLGLYAGEYATAAKRKNRNSFFVHRFKCCNGYCCNICGIPAF
jgi:CrcB protein